MIRAFESAKVMSTDWFLASLDIVCSASFRDLSNSDDLYAIYLNQFYIIQHTRVIWAKTTCQTEQGESIRKRSVR